MRVKFLVSLLLNFVIFQFLNTYVFATEKVEEEGGFAHLLELEKVFANIVSVLAIAGGFISFIVVIVGGFKFITAQGDPKAFSSARNTVTWGVLGLAFIIFAWLILIFIQQFTGVPVTIFKIGF